MISFSTLIKAIFYQRNKRQDKPLGYLQVSEIQDADNFVDNLSYRLMSFTANLA